METIIQTARDMHVVESAEQYRAKFDAYIIEQRLLGRRVQLHAALGQKRARICRNQWLFDCECGNGVATDPEWGIGCCHGCGALHTDVSFPDDWPEIERLMLERPRTENRNWFPHETVDDLRRENREHGVA